MRALFLTWDGPQQSYLESLFFPIFAGLRERGIDVHTLQLTWADRGQLEAVETAAAHFATPYTSKRVPAYARKLGLPVALALGAVAAARYARAHGIETLLPRSLIPMGMALLAKRARPGLDLAFEADGLMADERVDFGGWSRRGPSYRLLRRVEASGVRRARSVVCRTEAAREILIERAGGELLAERAKIFVAPNGKDAQRFSLGTLDERLATRARYGVPAGAPWIVYVGSIGPQYVPELMLAAMARIRERLPTACFSLFTFHGDALRRLLASQAELTAAVRIEPARPSEVPAILAAADLGFALRLEAFSQRGVCPIKVAEYLLCGLPVVTSPVGDLQAQLGGEPAAFVVSGAARGAADGIADWFVRSVLPRREELRDNARQLGLKWFDMASSIDSYEKMLRYRVAAS